MIFQRTGLARGEMLDTHIYKTALLKNHLIVPITSSNTVVIITSLLGRFNTISIFSRQ